jgi:3-phytase
MPEGRSVGIFGVGVLRRPYGIATYTQSDGGIAVYVTDNYETPNEQIPPDDELGRRVHHFVVRHSGDTVEATHVRAFGDTHGPGLLRKVETIGVDAVYDRLLIAEELETIREIKVYTLAGRFTGQVIPNRLFKYEPEGLALYPCGEKDGFWVATDQHPVENVFHLLDRRTLELRGTFKGEKTRQTDGITLTPGTLGALRGGAVYASHMDAHVSAFSWEAIAQATGLQAAGCW